MTPPTGPAPRLLGRPGAPPPERRSRLFWPLAVCGWATMAYAVRGLLQHHRETNPFAFTRLLVGLDVVHDLVVVPLVILVGTRLVRLVSPRFRAPVTGGLVVSAMVALYAYPFVRGFGRALGPSPSRLPNNYAAGLLAVLGTVWVATGLVAVARARRR